jgi:hypothetical protein
MNRDYFTSQVHSFLGEHARFEKFHVAVSVSGDDSVLCGGGLIILRLPQTENIHKRISHYGS